MDSNTNPSNDIEEKQSNVNINDYETSFFLTRLPSRKMKFKQLIYKRRLNYVDKDLRYMWIKADQGDSDFKANFTGSDAEEVLNKLIYSADLTFNLRDSRREAKLKCLLDERIKQLNELKRLKRMKQS